MPPQGPDEGLDELVHLRGERRPRRRSRPKCSRAREASRRNDATHPHAVRGDNHIEEAQAPGARREPVQRQHLRGVCLAPGRDVLSRSTKNLGAGRNCRHLHERLHVRVEIDVPLQRREDVLEVRQGRRHAERQGGGQPLRPAPGELRPGTCAGGRGGSACWRGAGTGVLTASPVPLPSSRMLSGAIRPAQSGGGSSFESPS